ncbi:hypothetical protein EVAR_18843_1 [Eumeta japonica]|uniref:Uncharacterized protein n=1 Tax=Eumeta variegata TaxID=151549 RepID=A0A4C1UMZ7_EUMVA|nr:hypothetical protein EVAR_18843_1 [Eumeta japonica]
MIIAARGHPQPSRSHRCVVNLLEKSSSAFVEGGNGLSKTRQTLAHCKKHNGGTCYFMPVFTVNVVRHRGNAPHHPAGRRAPLTYGRRRRERDTNSTFPIKFREALIIIWVHQFVSSLAAPPPGARAADERGRIILPKLLMFFTLLVFRTKLDADRRISVRAFVSVRHTDELTN